MAAVICAIRALLLKSYPVSKCKAIVKLLFHQLSFEHYLVASLPIQSSMKANFSFLQSALNLRSWFTLSLQSAASRLNVVLLRELAVVLHLVKLLLCFFSSAARCSYPTARQCQLPPSFPSGAGADMDVADQHSLPPCHKIRPGSRGLQFL